MYRRFAIAMIFALAPTISSANAVCPQQKTLLETLAAIQKEPSTLIVGPDRRLLVIGVINEEGKFDGSVFGSDGLEEPIVLQISRTPHEFFNMVSRTPPAITGMPQPNASFIGLAFPPPYASHPAGSGPYYIFGTECAEGYVTEPAAEYLDRVKRCLGTGDCRG